MVSEVRENQGKGYVLKATVKDVSETGKRSTMSNDAERSRED